MFTRILRGLFSQKQIPTGVDLGRLCSTIRVAKLIEAYNPGAHGITKCKFRTSSAMELYELIRSTNERLALGLPPPNKEMGPPSQITLDGYLTIDSVRTINLESFIPEFVKECNELNQFLESKADEQSFDYFKIRTQLMIEDACSLLTHLSKIN